MDAGISDLIQQAWRVGLLVVLPAFIIPVAGAVSSLVLGLFGVRDEGLAYAVRVLAMVAVAALCIPACSDDVVALMRMALQ
jgi:type III secretory pathway component EscS